MASQSKIKEVYDLCCKEMFLRVGETYPNEELVKQNNWYESKSWTEQEQNEFRDWMISYLRKALRLSKKKAQGEVGMFLLNYGWTTRKPLAMKTVKT